MLPGKTVILRMVIRQAALREEIPAAQVSMLPKEAMREVEARGSRLPIMPVSLWEIPTCRVVQALQTERTVPDLSGVFIRILGIVFPEPLMGAVAREKKFPMPTPNRGISSAMQVM